MPRLATQIGVFRTGRPYQSPSQMLTQSCWTSADRRSEQAVGAPARGRRSLLLAMPSLAIVLVGGPGAEPAAASASKSRANIIVLLTDDQETASMRMMKTVRKEMKRKGVTMKRFYDNFPLCCPVAHDACSPASTPTITRCSPTRRPTAATASSTSFTATTTCRSGSRPPATAPATSASSSTSTPSPTSTGRLPTDVPRGLERLACAGARRARSTSATR